jgi:hypothetical protein
MRGSADLPVKWVSLRQRNILVFPGRVSHYVDIMLASEYNRIILI